MPGQRRYSGQFAGSHCHLIVWACVTNWCACCRCLLPFTGLVNTFPIKILQVTTRYSCWLEKQGGVAPSLHIHYQEIAPPSTKLYGTGTSIITLLMLSCRCYPRVLLLLRHLAA